jgi:hypothetical protein
LITAANLLLGAGRDESAAILIGAHETYPHHRLTLAEVDAAQLATAAASHAEALARGGAMALAEAVDFAIAELER